MKIKIENAREHLEFILEGLICFLEDLPRPAKNLKWWKASAMDGYRLPSMLTRELHELVVAALEKDVITQEQLDNINQRMPMLDRVMIDIGMIDSVDGRRGVAAACVRDNDPHAFTATAKISEATRAAVMGGGKNTAPTRTSPYQEAMEKYRADSPSIQSFPPTFECFGPASPDIKPAATQIKRQKKYTDLKDAVRDNGKQPAVEPVTYSPPRALKVRQSPEMGG